VEPITASTPTRPREFLLTWNNATHRWNTDDVLRLLGSVGDPIDYGVRGVLSLGTSNLHRDVAPDQTVAATIASMSVPFDRGLMPNLYGLGSYLPSGNQSLVFCTGCIPFPNVGSKSTTDVPNVHPSNVLLTQASINAADNPAVALGVLWSTFAKHCTPALLDNWMAPGQETVLL
jgi:hypothetical protein